MRFVRSDSFASSLVVLAALVAFAAIASAGCTDRADTDQLSEAREHLHGVPCGPLPAVAGVAGVNVDRRQVYLGDWIVVSVCHLDELTHNAEAEQQPITLFIEGIDSGNQPTGIDFDTGTITFVLDRNAQNKELWRQFLYDPLFDPYAVLRVSLGIRGGRPLVRAEGANLTLRLKKLFIDRWTWLWFLLLIGVGIGLLVYARRSDMLRDGPSVGGVHQPYSLAKSQMAWWFFLVLAGYVFIWLVTEDRDSISPSLIGLLGISSATALAAAAVTPEGGRQAARRRRIDDGIRGASDQLTRVGLDLEDAARLAVQGSTAGAKLRSALEQPRIELEAMRDKLIVERASTPVVPGSEGWWRDVVTDDGGAIALDRIQVVVWTLVLGGVFLTSVVWDLTMPEFNATLLAVMGVSSGTYIGFKLPLRSLS
jgi:hypothetical protein